MGKSLGKCPLGRLRRWEDNIEIGRSSRWEVVEAGLGLCPLVGFGFSSGESSGSVTIHSVCLLCEVVVKLSNIPEYFVLLIKFRKNDLVLNSTKVCWAGVEFFYVYKQVVVEDMFLQTVNLTSN
jgi:hypothetical protein